VHSAVSGIREACARDVGHSWSVIIRPTQVSESFDEEESGHVLRGAESGGATLCLAVQLYPSQL